MMNGHRWNPVKTALVSGCVLLGLLGGVKSGLFTQAIAQVTPPATNQPQPEVDPMTMDVDSRLVTAHTQFGFNLFSQVLQENPGENVVISPTSVAIALSMTYNGASGATQQAMAQALALQGLSLDDLNQANILLQETLENVDSEVQLAIANSLWAHNGMAFNPDFLQRSQEFYQSEITNLDFASADAPGQINDWVSRQTDGKIPTIVDRINPNDVMFLINAIYFQGDWSHGFDVNQTSDRPFHQLDGTTKQHPMMLRQADFSYYETDQFQAVNLPYGDGQLSMYVFLPSETSSLQAFQQSLTTTNWNTWMTQFRNRSGSLELPRFKVEYGTALKDALTALGMGVAFDPNQADFSNLSGESIYINQVHHKTYIDVNEEGTEAAAATSVEIAVTSIQIPTDPFQMTVDRPFFFAIRDNQTGTVLFMGSVVNPE